MSRNTSVKGYDISSDLIFSNSQKNTSDLDFEFTGNNNQRAVLLLHGMTGSPFEMKQYGKKLYKEGFDIYCPCLPGHGKDIHNVKYVKYQDWLQFSEEKYLALKKNYSEVYLGGICMGAAIALAIAEKNKDVSGIISISTTLFLDGWVIPWYSFLMPFVLYTILRYYYTFFEQDPYGIKNEKVRKKISSLMKENTVALDCIPMACVYELLQMSKQVRNNISKIKQPILIIHSNRDDLTSLKSADFVYKNVSSKIKDYIIFKNSYHLIIMDNDKEAAVGKSVEFLNNISACLY